jgi:hypothetical protein
MERFLVYEKTIKGVCGTRLGNVVENIDFTF